MRNHFAFASSALLLLAGGPAAADDKTFDEGSLIIPMDRTYQDTGIYQAYGLLYELLRQGVHVYWVIDQEKTWHQERCDDDGNECAWDCEEEGSDVKCTYPTASPDFTVAAQVVWSDAGDPGGTVIPSHGYRGGPFVVDAADRDDALAIIDAWNDQNLWDDNEWAARDVVGVVTVHETTASFTGNVKKEMIAAPTIAVFSDGNEDIATHYLRAAGIPQSTGDEFPDGACGDDDCGPGTDNPDMLTLPAVAGDMGTCDAPNMDHRNGALFKDNGEPAYCQIMSMHWDVSKRETVECDGGDCGDSQEECGGKQITYHGHEAVAEVRSFLGYSTHFFAECQAVNAYENTVPNPAWPYLDDAGRRGHFLTTTGDPPDCPCDPGPDEGDFECVPDGCGDGHDCCLPKEAKEVGAGFLIADSPNPFKILRPEVAYMQFDGLFAPQGGSEPAYNLSTYLGTEYINDQDVTFITATDGPGVQDLWMTGYLDGECDIDDPGSVDLRFPGSSRAGDMYCGGKVSYLGGHQYKDRLGQRLFLNALFEADCVTNPDWPGGAGGGGGDADGDGISDGNDECPNDAECCGDADNDTCDDCVSGMYDPDNDGPDEDADGACDDGEEAAGTDGDGDGDGGCGCRAGSGSGAGSLALLFVAVLLGVRRRRRLPGAA